MWGRETPNSSSDQESVQGMVRDNNNGIPTATPAYPICGERTYLPAELAGRALKFAAGDTVGLVDVERELRCTLQDHDTGDHFALVVELDGTYAMALWTRWMQGRSPATVVVLLDCDAVSRSTGEPCCEFADHPGRHSYELADPWSPFVVASL